MSSPPETIFRITFALLWLLFFGVRVYFQRKGLGVREYERVNEKQEKLLFKLFALAYLIMPLYFLTPWLDFARLPLPAWLRWLGGAVTCAGIGLFGWAHQALGMNWTAVLALSKEHELITNGPYRSVRHPMYSAFFMIGVGLLLLSANGFIGVTYLGTLLLMIVARVSLEENMMIERFGDAYRQYMKKTGRLFPRF
jgi:protein-S-isoprenylcysteine O-methyltransferase Ste14